jgi:hypothetical protein
MPHPSNAKTMRPTTAPHSRAHHRLMAVIAANCGTVTPVKTPGGHGKGQSGTLALLKPGKDTPQPTIEPSLKSRVESTTPTASTTPVKKPVLNSSDQGVSSRSAAAVRPADKSEFVEFVPKLEIPKGAASQAKPGMPTLETDRTRATTSGVSRTPKAALLAESDKPPDAVDPVVAESLLDFRAECNSFADKQRLHIAGMGYHVIVATVRKFAEDWFATKLAALKYRLDAVLASVFFPA